MKHRPIAFNLVRGLLGAFVSAPRGIERIDFGYLSYLFENWPGDCYGVLPMPWGMRFYSRDRVLKARDRLAAYWRETSDTQGIADDATYARVVAWLNDQPLPAEGAQSRPKRRTDMNGYWRAAKLLMGDGIDLGRPVRRLPRQTIYIDIGHNGISREMFVAWLKARPDISPVFMLHDTIPLDFPEFVTPGGVTEHARVMQNAAQFAHAIITPTPAAAASIHARFTAQGHGDIPIHPIGLPIDAAFHPEEHKNAKVAGRPYFLICGAIERRKNHALLLDVWDELAARHGTATPRLVIAGRPNTGSEAVINRIRQSEVLSRHIHVASGLSTPAIARLIAGARALLMPSFAEGFGLPPVEALTLGTPAILSDIAAHREATEGYGIYLNARDRSEWTRAIEMAMADTPDYLALKTRIAGFTPLDWTGYMHRVEALLVDL